VAVVAREPAPRRVIEPASNADRVRESVFRTSLLLATCIGLLFLAVLLVDTALDGAPYLSWDFLSSFASRINPEQAGIRAALLGTLWLIVTTAVVIIPIGVATAVYLEEYADRDRWWNRVIELNIQNLAAVPSVVYGILGLAFIVRGPIDLGRVTLAGALTLALLVLPVVIVVSREAIRAVPPSIREGSLALGATEWQTIWRQVLPGALPGIATGVILALSRAIGETAPLILVGAASFVLFDPQGLFGAYSALPIQIFEFVRDREDVFQDLAAAAILVLLAILLLMNSVAIYLRNKYEQKW
jgi:phosphate transport system permease protein